MAGNIKDMIIVEPGNWWDDGSHALGPYDTLDKTYWPVEPGATTGSYRFSNVFQLAYNGITSGRPATIRICEGTQKYQITDTTRFNKYGVRVIQEPGAVMQLSNSLTTHGFSLETEVVWEHLNLELDVSAVNADRSVFKARTCPDTVAANANRTAGVSKFIRTTGSWTDDGYGVETIILGSGYSNAGNNNTFIVLAVSTTTNPNDTLTVRDRSGVVVTESGGAGVIKRQNSFAGTKFYKGKVSLCPLAAAIPGFFVFDFLGPNDSWQVPGIGFHNIDFIVRSFSMAGADSVQQTNAWSGTEFLGTPYGLGLFKLANLRAFEIASCHYFSRAVDYLGDNPETATNWGGIYLLQDGCLQGNIHDGLFDGVALMASTKPEALPFMVFRNSTGNEGGHTTVHSFRTENVVAKAFYFSNSPWVKMRDIDCGRWVPGRMTAFSILRPSPGTNKVRQCDVLGCSAHNCPGFSNTGTYSMTRTNDAAGTIDGTGVGTGFEVGQYIRPTGFSSDMDDQCFQITSVGANSLGITPGPVTISGAASRTVTLQPVVVSAQNANDCLWGDGNWAFRRSIGPLYDQIGDQCSGNIIHGDEPADGPQPTT